MRRLPYITYTAEIAPVCGWDRKEALAAGRDALIDHADVPADAEYDIRRPYPVDVFPAGLRDGLAAQRGPDYIVRARWQREMDGSA